MDSNQTRIKELFEKFSNREATPEETKELFQLSLNGADEKEFLELLGAKIEDTEPDDNYNKHLWDAVFAQVKDDITAIEGDVVTKKKRPFGFARIAFAAAVAVVIFVAGLFFYQQQKITTDSVQLTQTPIVPGRNKAILTLANGKKISLSEASLGQIAAQSGVKISKTADGQLVYDASDASNVKDDVEYNTIEAPVGGKWQVKLPDGSIVFLNALSSLTYPTRFTGKTRDVKMLGEAYFEIARNKALPFRVSSMGQTVEVLGTHFNIMAYADEKIIKTTLLEGSVRVSDHGKTELLKPGEQAQVSASNIMVTNDVDLEDVVAWKNGYFKFNESLETIMNKIARWYDVQIIYQGKVDRAMEFGGEISRSKNISSALKIMELTGNVHFKIEGRRVTVMP